MGLSGQTRLRLLKTWAWLAGAAQRAIDAP